MMTANLVYSQTLIYFINLVTQFFHMPIIIGLFEMKYFHSIHDRILTKRTFWKMIFGQILLLTFFYYGMLRNKYSNQEFKLLDIIHLITFYQIHTQSMFNYILLNYFQFLIYEKLKSIQRNLNLFIEDNIEYDCDQTYYLVDQYLTQLSQLSSISRRVWILFSPPFLTSIVAYTLGMISIISVYYIRSVLPLGLVLRITTNFILLTVMVFINSQTMFRLRLVFIRFRSKILIKSINYQTFNLKMFYHHQNPMNNDFHNLLLRWNETQLYWYYIQARLFDSVIIDYSFMLGSLLFALNYILLIVQTYQ